MPKFKQEMPPPGGYSSIDWAKKLPNKINVRKYWLAYIGITVSAYSIWLIETRIKQRWRIEMNDSRLALEPLLVAEEHRQLLRQLRKNRDDEKELMKRVPGWVTGTLWGEPTGPRVRGQFPVIHAEAYFAHHDPQVWYDHFTERKWH